MGKTSAEKCFTMSKLSGFIVANSTRFSFLKLHIIFPAIFLPALLCERRGGDATRTTTKGEWKTTWLRTKARWRGEKVEISNFKLLQLYLWVAESYFRALSFGVSSPSSFCRCSCRCCCCRDSINFMFMLHFLLLAELVEMTTLIFLIISRFYSPWISPNVKFLLIHNIIITFFWLKHKKGIFSRHYQLTQLGRIYVRLQLTLPLFSLRSSLESNVPHMYAGMECSAIRHENRAE